MPMFSGHGTRPEGTEAHVGGICPQIALATERFLDPQTGLALLICRARRRTHGTTRTSRTSRDAYAKRDNAKTSNSELEFPVGEPSVYTPNLRSFDFTLGDTHTLWVYCLLT